MKKTMLAANLHAVADLRVEHIAVPECAPDEVLVAVKYCGICGSDLPRIFVRGTYHFPTVPGHEFSGVVEYDPQGELTGKPVAVFPLLPCFSCPSCQEGNYATCSHYDYYGSRRNGGMEEYLAVKRWNLVLIPEGVSLKEGALCEPAAVARHAVFGMDLTAGSRLLISGAGPIGLLAGQWARKAGAVDVCFLDIDDRKIDFAKRLGFSAYSKGMHFDHALEGTGHSNALETCISALNAFGSLTLLGTPAGDIALPQDIYGLILRKELRIQGSWNSSYNNQVNDWKESLRAMADGTLKVGELITHEYRLSECGEALRMMCEKQEMYAKVLLKIGE